MRVNMLALGGTLEVAERKEYSKRDGTSGSMVVFQMRVKRQKGDGEDLIGGVAWGQSGKFLLEQCQRGDPILAQGSLEVREWRDKNDMRHTEYRINANSIQGEGGTERAEKQARSSRETSGDGYSGYQEAGAAASGYIADDPFSD